MGAALLRRIRCSAVTAIATRSAGSRRHSERPRRPIQGRAGCLWRRHRNRPPGSAAGWRPYHFARIDDAVEIRLVDEAELERGLLQREVMLRSVVGDLRGLLV